MKNLTIFVLFSHFWVIYLGSKSSFEMSHFPFFFISLKFWDFQFLCFFWRVFLRFLEKKCPLIFVMEWEIPRKATSAYAYPLYLPINLMFNFVQNLVIARPKRPNRLWISDRFLVSWEIVGDLGPATNWLFFLFA